MRAAKMKERPSFQLMVQTDVQSIYHMQMPRWLFSDPRYCEMSLDAKVTYTFLLNRFQLSRRNGWVNERGEVFVIFDRSQIEVSPSVLKPTHDGLTDEEREDDFLNILDACELTGFAPGTALVFENAIERLYYSDSYRIGNATLPQSRVRAKLRRLDGMILREAERKLHENQEQNVKNSTAYTMAVLFNCIAESESDLLVDPYLNALSSTA